MYYFKSINLIIRQLLTFYSKKKENTHHFTHFSPSNNITIKGDSLIDAVRFLHSFAKFLYKIV